MPTDDTSEVLREVRGVAEGLVGLRLEVRDAIHLCDRVAERLELHTATDRERHEAFASQLDDRLQENNERLAMLADRSRALDARVQGVELSRAQISGIILAVSVVAGSLSWWLGVIRG